MPSPRQAARGASASADASHSLRRLACTECRRRKQKVALPSPVALWNVRADCVVQLWEPVQ